VGMCLGSRGLYSVVALASALVLPSRGPGEGFVDMRRLNGSVRYSYASSLI